MTPSHKTYPLSEKHSMTSRFSGRPDLPFKVSKPASGWSAEGAENKNPRQFMVHLFKDVAGHAWVHSIIKFNEDFTATVAN